MAILRTAAEFVVKFNDVFHLRNLYVMLHEYLKEEGWSGMQGASDHSDIETLYLEKIDQKSFHAGGKEMWVYWRLWKFSENKLNYFSRNLLNVDFNIKNMNDVEIMHQGKKLKVQSGRLDIMITARIEMDYKDEWEHHWFLKHFLEFYIARLFSHEFEKREKELWREAYKLQGKIKRFLEMHTFIPTPEPFHPVLYGTGQE